MVALIEASICVTVGDCLSVSNGAGPGLGEPVLIEFGRLRLPPARWDLFGGDGERGMALAPMVLGLAIVTRPWAVSHFEFLLCAMSGLSARQQKAETRYRTSPGNR
jgi:hypothetical protein